jgi:transcriptional regulator with XRE-family HTH domain
MFELYLLFGPRKGMVAKIKGGRLDFANSRLHVTLNKQKGNKVPPVLKLLLPDYLRQMLFDHVTKYGIKSNEFLFTVRDISHSLKSAAKAAGMGNWYHHAFPKLVATRMIEAGIPIPIIAALLSHRDCGATILKNYWNYSQNALDSAVLRYAAGLSGANVNANGDLIQIKARLIEVVEHVCAAPPEIMKAVIEHLLRLDADLLVGNYSKALEQLSTPPKVALPQAATAAVPHVPEYVPEDKRAVVAGNVIYLTLRHGWGTHELETELGLYSNAIYNLRRGQGLNRQTLKKLARHFGVGADYFANPDNPQADLALIQRNLHYLADKLGAASLPFPAVTAKVLQGTDLPCGKLLHRLSEEFPFLTIGKLMTVEIGNDTGMVQAVENLTRDRDAAKASIAAHIHLHEMLTGVNGMALAKLTGLKPNQIHAYASGRQLPPDENVAKIALALGLSTTQPLQPVVLPNPVDVGHRVAAWLAAKGLKASTATLKMVTSAKEFVAVVEGKRLPSARQLHKIGAFLGKNTAEILGLKAAPSSPTEIGEAMAPTTADKQPR